MIAASDRFCSSVGSSSDSLFNRKVSDDHQSHWVGGGKRNLLNNVCDQVLCSCSELLRLQETRSSFLSPLFFQLQWYLIWSQCLRKPVALRDTGNATINNIPSNPDAWGKLLQQLFKGFSIYECWISFYYFMALRLLNVSVIVVLHSWI